MSRTRKICVASAVVMIGVLLAWPFRRTSKTAFEIPEPVEILRSANGDPITEIAPPANTPYAEMTATGESISAVPASTLLTTRDEPAHATGEGFDVANHPALAGVQHRSEPEGTAANQSAESDPSTESTTADSARPAYATISTAPASGPLEELWPQEVLHVVRNGDTLERLAERYLDDSQRAFEIFDLNRDQLSNPHLLPIGVELRIPAENSRQID